MSRPYRESQTAAHSLLVCFVSDMTRAVIVQFAPPANAFEEEEEGKSTEGVTRLYGEWQTTAWASPAAVDGTVPRNERGNVNVPPYATQLPAGVSNFWLGKTLFEPEVPGCS